MEIKTTILKKEVPFTVSLDIFKQAEEAGEFHVVGYAATTDFDKQGDIITAEALKAAVEDLLKNSTVLLNHDLKRPIGRVVSVKFDKRGLLIDTLISSTEPDVIQKIKEGVLNKFSIRGSVLERERKWDKEKDRVINVIKRVALVEASLVSVPANPEAKAVGWYIKKALETEDSQEGGTDMDPKKNEGAGVKPADEPNKGAPAPAADPAKPAASAPTPSQPPAEAPKAPPATPPAATPEQPKDQMAGMMKMFEKMAAQALAPLLAKLDQIASMGDDKMKGMAQEAKGMVQALMTQDASPTASKEDGGASASQPPTQPDMSSAVAAEVSKQVKKALDDIPSLRKGMVPDGNGQKPEANAEEIMKAFEKLDPSDKLRTLLTVQHSRNAT